jgi:hypothetical protein
MPIVPHHRTFTGTTTMTNGFAAVDFRGQILIKTVSETRRAAMVNWLVTEGRVMVFRDSTDAEIEEDISLQEQRGAE